MAQQGYGHPPPVEYPNQYPPQGYGGPQPGPYPPPGGQYPPPQQGYAGAAQPGYAAPPVAQQPGYTAAPPGQMWMPIPQAPSNCPPGLEYLTQIDQLLIHQQVELLEAFTGFETNNKYEVKNSLGQQVYFAAEDSKIGTPTWKKVVT